MVTVPDLVIDGTVQVADSVYPAKVTLDGQAFSDDVKLLLVKVRERDWAVMVYAELETGTELVLFQETNEFDLRHLDRLVRLDDGRVLMYSPGTGCGCGSRLRSFRPADGERLVIVNRPESTPIPVP